MKKVIEIQGLCKKFIIDINPLTMLNLFKRSIKPQSHYMEVWALKDIHIEVAQGDRIGLIGKNGSGKTTLLRIIAGLYQKSSGSIFVHGATAAFLQMGIGMERNLTALENIFLFGAIMGVERREIKRRLDDIVQFAEIEDFINCPFRDLSSGMIQRVAFSIARLVETDILLLDEMLATGDIGFRKKCYHVLEEYAKGSKTIIITSHEMEMIRRFCNKCLWLEKGNQVAFGPTQEVLEAYIRCNAKG